MDLRFDFSEVLRKLRNVAENGKVELHVGPPAQGRTVITAWRITPRTINLNVEIVGNDRPSESG